MVFAVTWNLTPADAMHWMPEPYLFGNEAYYVDGLDADPAKALPQAVACVAANPAKQCQIRQLFWTGTPSLLPRLFAVLKAGKDQGTDVILCKMDNVGHLRNCASTSDAASAVIGGLAADFFAPWDTGDGVPLVNTNAVIVLDWKRLHEASLAAVPPARPADQQ
jgi:hypothetical protein